MTEHGSGLRYFRFRPAAGGHANDADHLEAEVSFESSDELDSILRQLDIHIEPPSGWTTLHGIETYVIIDRATGTLTLDLASDYSVSEKDWRNARRLEAYLERFELRFR